MNTSKEQISSLRRQGLTLLQGNHLEEAKALFTEIARIHPDDADAWHKLTSIYGMLGDMDEAGNCCRKVITLQPAHSEAHANLGNVLFHKGRHDEAITHYQAALCLNPNNAVAHNNLGNTLKTTGRLAEAIESYQRATTISPNYAIGHYNFGIALKEAGRLQEAGDCFRHAVALNPNYADAYNHLGILHNTQGHIELAIAHYRQAIALNPNHADAYNNLGITLVNMGRMIAAEEMVQRALRIRPDFANAYNTLGDILNRQGKPGEAVKFFQKVLELSPEHVTAHSNLLMTMHYLPQYSLEDFLTTAKGWNSQHTHRTSRDPLPANSPDPQRRLRIGYVSADFHNHPVGYFIASVLSHHNKKQYEIFCYYNDNKHDDLNAHLHGSANHWRVIEGQSDQVVADRIRQDGIDILIDLSGHTAKNRLHAFTYKPAPIQATWMGYFATTGLTDMDYIIADRFVIPPNEDCYYTELVERLPHGYLCFTVPDLPLPVSTLPALSQGVVTFGSFNNPAKLTSATISCWSKLLHALPDSTLFLKYKSFEDDEVIKYFQSSFVKHGVDVERIRFSGYSPRNDLLAAYNEVDIALDSFPYNGGTTTAEALWMGIPVISLRGDRFVGRVGESILTTVGLEELVVDSEETYIAKGIELASDLPRLADLRGRLRQKVVDSPLCDGVTFTQDLEAVYRKMWTTWCHNHGYLGE